MAKFTITDGSLEDRILDTVKAQWCLGWIEEAAEQRLYAWRVGDFWGPRYLYYLVSFDFAAGYYTLKGLSRKAMAREIEHAFLAAVHAAEPEPRQYAPPDTYCLPPDLADLAGEEQESTRAMRAERAASALASRAADTSAREARAADAAAKARARAREAKAKADDAYSRLSVALEAKLAAEAEWTAAQSAADAAHTDACAAESAADLAATDAAAYRRTPPPIGDLLREGSR